MRREKDRQAEKLTSGVTLRKKNRKAVLIGEMPLAARHATAEKQHRRVEDLRLVAVQ